MLFYHGNYFFWGAFEQAGGFLKWNSLDAKTGQILIFGWRFLRYVSKFKCTGFITFSN
jgi:hypothetical protein